MIARQLLLFICLLVLTNIVKSQDFAIYDNQSIIQTVQSFRLSSSIRKDSVALHKIFAEQLLKFHKFISNDPVFCGSLKAWETLKVQARKDQAVLIKLDVLIQNLSTVKDSLSTQLAKQYNSLFRQAYSISLMDNSNVLYRDSTIGDQTTAIVSFIKDQRAINEIVEQYEYWLEEQITDPQLNILLKDWIEVRFKSD